MNPEEFRQAYFDQYAEDDERCDDEWFRNYFDNSVDWLEVEYRGNDEEFVVYSDPESDIGGFWVSSSFDEVEGPFQTMAEVAEALGYSPRNFPPDQDADEEDDDDELGDALEEDDLEFDVQIDDEEDDEGFDDEDEDYDGEEDEEEEDDYFDEED